MKKRIGYVFMIYFITVLSAYAQVETKTDLRIGIARTILGTGDIRTTTFETEFNYKINPYFTTAISLNYGIGDEQTYGTASYVQGNTNVFISPFRNTKALDFRIGGGLSYYVVSQVTAQSVGCGPNGCIAQEYSYERRNEFGYNVITEIAYRLNEKFLLGMKLYTQPFFNGDINTGIMAKLGVKI